MAKKVFMLFANATAVVIVIVIYSYRCRVVFIIHTQEQYNVKHIVIFTNRLFPTTIYTSQRCINPKKKLAHHE